MLSVLILSESLVFKKAAVPATRENKFTISLNLRKQMLSYQFFTFINSYQNIEIETALILGIIYKTVDCPLDFMASLFAG